MAREECFKCSSAQENVFDLHSMSCIAEASCSNGRLLGTLKGLYGVNRFCRGKLLKIRISADPAIFVDLGSLEELETGTRAFPYKSLVAALKEVLNEHRGTSEHVHVFVKEGSVIRFSDHITTLNVKLTLA